MVSGRDGSNPPKKFICEICGKEFERIVYPSSEGLFKFCSPACRNKAQIKPMVPCTICEKMFKPHSAGRKKYAKYCSRQCASIAQKGKPAHRKYSEEIRRFVKDTYPLQGPVPTENKYALSKEQVKRLAYRMSLKLTERPEPLHKGSNPAQPFICKGCGQTFYKVWFPSRKEPKYCSNKCKKRRVPIVCATCGITFEALQSQKETRKYCSRTCKDIRNGEKIPIVCEVCEITFIVPLSRKKARFCSRKCRYSKKCNRVSYGSGWTKKRDKALERDNYQCQVPDCPYLDAGLHVHHIIPLRLFYGDLKASNDLSNLVTICNKHHNSVERGFIPCPQIKED